MPTGPPANVTRRRSSTMLSAIVTPFNLTYQNASIVPLLAKSALGFHLARQEELDVLAKMLTVLNLTAGQTLPRSSMYFVMSGAISIRKGDWRVLKTTRDCVFLPADDGELDPRNYAWSYAELADDDEDEHVHPDARYSRFDRMSMAAHRRPMSAEARTRLSLDRKLLCCCPRALLPAAATVLENPRVGAHLRAASSSNPAKAASDYRRTHLRHSHHERQRSSHGDLLRHSNADRTDMPARASSSEGESISVTAAADAQVLYLSPRGLLRFLATSKEAFEAMRHVLRTETVFGSQAQVAEVPVASPPLLQQLALSGHFTTFEAGARIFGEHTKADGLCVLVHGQAVVSTCPSVAGSVPASSGASEASFTSAVSSSGEGGPGSWKRSLSTAVGLGACASSVGPSSGVSSSAAPACSACGATGHGGGASGGASGSCRGSSLHDSFRSESSAPAGTLGNFSGTVLAAGAVFGELASLLGWPTYCCTAVAKSRSLVMTVPMSALKPLFGRLPALEEAVGREAKLRMFETLRAESASLFADLSDERLRIAAREAMLLVDVKRGAPICSQGEPAHSTYLVLGGKVDATRQPQPPADDDATSLPPSPPNDSPPASGGASGAAALTPSATEASSAPTVGLLAASFFRPLESGPPPPPPPPPPQQQQQQVAARTDRSDSHAGWFLGKASEAAPAADDAAAAAERDAAALGAALEPFARGLSPAGATELPAAVEGDGLAAPPAHSGSPSLGSAAAAARADQAYQLQPGEWFAEIPLLTNEGGYRASYRAGPHGATLLAFPRGALLTGCAADRSLIAEVHLKLLRQRCSLHHILDHRRARALFSAYLDSCRIGASHALNFYLAVRRYERVQALDLPAALLSISQSIVGEFVHSRSAHAVHLSTDDAREQIMSASERGAVPIGIFLRESTAIFEMLQVTYVEGFLASPPFLDLLRVLGAYSTELADYHAPASQLLAFEAALLELQQASKLSLDLRGGHSMRPPAKPPPVGRTAPLNRLLLPAHQLARGAVATPAAHDALTV